MANPRQSRPLTPAEFKPLDAAGARRRWRLSPLYLGLGTVAAFGVLVFLYLMAARAVIFNLEPADATLTVSGLSFHIGDNYLLLPGSHTVSAEAEGYHPLTTDVEVSGARTQETDLVLEPLPGKLQVNSGLHEIEVFIDDEVAGMAPGLIEDIPRGSHIVEFRRYRYFPLRQEMEIEGLGRTQTVEVELEPAWGQMQISSVPERRRSPGGRPAGGFHAADGRSTGNRHPADAEKSRLQGLGKRALGEGGHHGDLPAGRTGGGGWHGERYHLAGRRPRQR